MCEYTFSEISHAIIVDKIMQYYTYLNAMTTYIVCKIFVTYMYMH